MHAVMGRILDHEDTKDREGREARKARSQEGEPSSSSRFVSSRDFTASCSKSFRRLARALRDILYGATVYEMVRDLHKERGQRERLFILAIFGDLLGVPILPPYYALRLLPYVVPSIAGWRRNLARERDLTDLCDQEIT